MKSDGTGEAAKAQLVSEAKKAFFGLALAMALENVSRETVSRAELNLRIAEVNRALSPEDRIPPIA